MLRRDLQAAGFVDAEIVLREESREAISGWLPGSGAEDWIVAAKILARKE